MTGAMNETALALKMKPLMRWLDSRCQPDDFTQRQFDAAPFGQCYVTMDPDRQGRPPLSIATASTCAARSRDLSRMA